MLDAILTSRDVNEHYVLHFETIAVLCQSRVQENIPKVWSPGRFGMR